VLWNLPGIRVPADPLYPGAWPFLTNTFLLTIVGSVLIIALMLFASRNPTMVPGRLQNLVEWVFEQFLNLCEQVAGPRRGRQFFPWVLTIFLFVLFANWWEVIPGIETIGLKTTDTALGPSCAQVGSQGVLLFKQYSNCITPFFRPPSTDLNFTIALALVTVVMTQVYGFVVLGFRLQISRYIVFNQGIMGFIVGIFELLLEAMRLISLSFRLFGNLFAGDVLLVVISFISVGVGAIPFYFLEIFVGFIQAFVFAFLTLLFFTLGTTAHGHEGHEESHAAEVAHAEHERLAQALALDKPEQSTAKPGA